MPGKITFVVHEADYVAACRANYLLQLRGPRFRRRVGIALAFVLAVTTGAGMWLMQDVREAAFFAASTTASGAAALAIILIGTLLLLPRRMSRLYRQQRSFDDPQQFTWSDEGVRWDSSRMHAEMPWGDYLQWHESRAALLLYLNEQMPHFVPIRAFDAAQAADLRATLVAHGPPRR